MARKEIVLQAFVASPSDLQEERAALEEVVRELNLTWDRNQAVRLDLWRWETHAYPGAGSDPQDVINTQAPSDFDIFIGILWARFGTPTPRAGSGTAEEFKNAYKRYTEGPKGPQIMVYFKDAPLAPSAIDPAQLSAVKSFKDNLGQEGVLYWSFGSIDNFKALLRMHLRKVVQNWLAENPIIPTTQDLSIAPARGQLSSIESGEEEGFIDLMEMAGDSIISLNAVATRMAESIATLGGKTAQRVSELNALRDAGSVDHVAVKRITTRAAEHLDEFVACSNADNPIFIEALRSFLEAFSRAASVSLDFTPGDSSHLKTPLEQLGTLRGIIRSTRAPLQSLRDTMAAVPRMTTVYNKAKRRAVAAMDITLAHFAEADDAFENAESTISGLL